MPGNRLRKLEIEPLVEALFELRFEGHDNFVDIFPGLLFSEISSEVKAERLPPAELPLTVRKKDPNLRYASVLALSFKDFDVMLSEHSILVSAKFPYLGWVKFRQQIIDIISLAFSRELISKIERFSLKYVNFLPHDKDEEATRMTNFQFTLGDLPADGNRIDCRFERQLDNSIVILRVVSHVQLQNAQMNEQNTGLILEIDTIRAPNQTEADSGFDFVDSNLDELKQLNVDNFLNMIADDTLEKLGPTYERDGS